MDKALEDAESALQQAEDAIALAQSVSDGFAEFQSEVNGSLTNMQTALNSEISTRQDADTALGNRVTALEGRADNNTTYALSKSGDNLILTGSDGNSTSVEITGGAPEASSESIMSIFE